MHFDLDLALIYLSGSLLLFSFLLGVVSRALGDGRHPRLPHTR